MNVYLLIKYIHMTSAVLSFLGFTLRGYWMLQDSPLLRQKLTKILPHIVDTVLLISAISLVTMSRQYPFVVDWVTVKVVLLIVYIGLGTFAMKRGKNKAQRTGFLVAAIVTIIAIFGVAATKPTFGL